MNKLKLLVVFVLLIVGQSFGQEINQFDVDGERDGVWRKYYPNKGLRFEGTFEHGKEVGVFRFFSMNSSKYPMVVKTYGLDSVKVLVQFFSNNGIVESEGFMIDKERVNTWVYFHKNSKNVMIEEEYKNGVLDGTYKLYYKNKNLTKIEHYKNGKLHGNSKQYSDTGVLTDDLNYENGYLHGAAIYYEPNGKIKQKGRYKEDLKVGVWEYYKEGVLSESKDLNKKKDTN